MKMNLEPDFDRPVIQVDEIIFPQMPIIACRDDAIPGYFLFSATMFSHMDYTIKNSTKEFVFTTFDSEASRDFSRVRLHYVRKNILVIQTSQLIIALTKLDNLHFFVRKY